MATGLLPLNGILKAVLPVGAERVPPKLTPPQARPIWQQTPTSIGNPWTRVPQQQNLVLYEQLVQTVPILQAAIDRTVELVGCPYIEGDDQVKGDWEEWSSRVVVNRIQTGFANWFPCWLYDCLLYGRSHTEMILPARRDDIYALQELHTRTIELNPAEDDYSVNLVQTQIGSGRPVILNRKLILTAAHNVHGDSPQGNSLLFGLPFVAEIITSMFKDEKRIWERFGTPSYHVRYNPPKEFNDPSGDLGQGYVAALMGLWNSMMASRANGEVQDFGTAGDVTVTVIGANGETLEFTETLRALMEQCVAVTGLPPMMLGLQWQAGERIGAVQAGLVTQRVEKIRNAVGGELSYMFRLRQQLAGRSDVFKWCWHAPTLMDMVETAKAEVMQEQANKARLSNGVERVRLGIYKPEDVARAERPELSEATDEEVRAKLPKLFTEAPPLPQPMPAGGQASQQPGEEQEKAQRRGVVYPRPAPLAKNGKGEH